MLKRCRVRFALTPLKFKITSIIVAATMVCSVTGCGAENKQSNPLSDTSKIVSESSGSSEASESSSISGVSNNPADSSSYTNSQDLRSESYSTFSEAQEKSDTRSPHSSAVSTNSQSAQSPQSSAANTSSQSAQSSQSSVASASSQSTSNSPTIYTKVVDGVTFEYQMEYFDTSGRFDAFGSVKFDTFDITYCPASTEIRGNQKIYTPPYYQVKVSGVVSNASKCFLREKEYDKDGYLINGTVDSLTFEEKFNNTFIVNWLGDGIVIKFVETGFIK